MNIFARFRSLRASTARRRAAIACGVLASLSVCTDAAAQFGPSIELPPGLPPVVMDPTPSGYPPTTTPTAAGTYLAPTAWSQTLAPNARFVILSNLSSDAVLDRETGLVWTRKTVKHSNAPGAADNICTLAEVGGRRGWRLPTSTELLSLVDTSRPQLEGVPRLPVGHPFLFPPGGDFPDSMVHWASDAPFAGGNVMAFFASGQPFLEPGRMVVNLSFGYAAEVRSSSAYTLGVLCVRGGPRL